MNTDEHRWRMILGVLIFIGYALMVLICAFAGALLSIAAAVILLGLTIPSTDALTIGLLLIGGAVVGGLIGSLIAVLTHRLISQKRQAGSSAKIRD